MRKNYGVHTIILQSILSISNIISKKSLRNCWMDTRAARMFSIVLFFLALSFDNSMIAFSHQIDDVILKFIIDVQPILFPPTRVSLHLCVSYDDTIRLSRKLSSLHLMHGIHNNVIPDFDRRIYDDLEHQNLYVLDLNCNYAIEILRQVNLNRMFVAPMKWLLLQDRRTRIDNDDNANLTFTHDNSILEVFEDLAVYPDSDVILATRLDGDFFQLTSVYRPSPQRGMISENRGNWTIENGLQMKTFDVASARRRNLQQTALKSVLVIMYPDSINHLDDYKYKTIDPLAKIGYIWVNHLTNRMNATVNFTSVNTWGEIKFPNGSSEGMVRMLIRHEIDLGGTVMYILKDRLSEIDYVSLPARVNAAFVFRQPLLSTVKNIFTLPFKKDVWIAIAVFLLVVFFLLYLSMKWEYNRNMMNKSSSSFKQTYIGDPTLGDDALILLGAFAQQGYAYEPFKISTRIITLMLLLASLLLYAAYTANIVALLQSPTDSIQTLSDLLHSPLTLAAEDVIYARNMFKTYKDPIRKAIVEEKIEPKGHKSNWMHVGEGVRRIKNEPFAFHGFPSRIYRTMQDLYQEDEKCGLTEVDFFNMVMPHLPLPKQSPYLEIIKNGALKLQEYGLKQRDEHLFFTKKPECSNQASYISISFTECHFVIVAMGYGVLLSLIVFALELLWYKIRNKNTIQETIPTVIEKKDLEIIEYID